VRSRLLALSDVEPCVSRTRCRSFCLISRRAALHSLRRPGQRRERIVLSRLSNLFQFGDFAERSAAAELGRIGNSPRNLSGGKPCPSISVRASAQSEHGHAIALPFDGPLLLRNLWRFFLRKKVRSTNSSTRAGVSAARRRAASSRLCSSNWMVRMVMEIRQG